MTRVMPKPVLISAVAIFLFALLSPAFAAGSSDRPTWDVTIRSVTPAPPSCVLRFSSNPSERLLEFTGSNFSTTNHNLQFRKAATGEQSIHFHGEVNWVSSTYLSVDMALIRDLLWPDPRVLLQARLTDAAYVPVSDWSPNFILADNQAACDHVAPPAAPNDFKVLMINFNPIIEAQGGVRLTQLMGWGDPAALTAQYVTDLNVASHGYVAYDIVTTAGSSRTSTSAPGWRKMASTRSGCGAGPTSAIGSTTCAGHTSTSHPRTSRCAGPRRSM